MYKLNNEETNQLASQIKKAGSRENAYKKIDEFAKSKGVYKVDIESCWVLEFSGDKIFNAMSRYH